MGLLACYIIHALNNIGANVSATVILSLFTGPVFYLVLIGIFIGIIVINRFISKKSKTEK